MTFLCYLGVQIVAYAMDLGGFLLLLHGLPAHPVVANAFGKVVAGTFAFTAHRHFTFRGAASQSARAQALKYLALLALNVPLSSGVLSLLLGVSSPLPAKFLSDVICVALTFWLSKAYVFAPPSRP